MADKVSITVERIGKFGVMSGGVWYNLSSKSGLKVSDFSPKTTYEVLVYTSDSGKKYINQIVGSGASLPNTSAGIPCVEGVDYTQKLPPKPKAGDDKLLEVIKKETKEVDWDKKNAQIRAQGTIQAAVQAQALSMYAANYDEWLALVEKTAKFELDFISKNS